MTIEQLGQAEQTRVFGTPTSLTPKQELAQRERGLPELARSYVRFTEIIHDPLTPPNYRNKLLGQREEMLGQMKYGEVNQLIGFITWKQKTFVDPNVPYNPK